MAQRSHDNDGVERNKRFSRAKADDCPICGDPFQSSMEMDERRKDGQAESLPGIAYEHKRGVCIEWADGEIVEK